MLATEAFVCMKLIDNTVGQNEERFVKHVIGSLLVAFQAHLNLGVKRQSVRDSSQGS
jgi:hypothetical protein